MRYVGVRDTDFCVECSLALRFGEVSLWKFPVNVYGLVLVCIGLGISVDVLRGWGGCGV